MNFAAQALDAVRFSGWASGTLGGQALSYVGWLALDSLGGQALGFRSA